MKNVIRIFIRLLADVSHLSRVAVKAPRDIDIPWILNEGPRLDKELLKYLETGHSAPLFPEWLRPLSDDVTGDHPDPQSLKYLRQILMFGYKAETISDESQNKTAQAEFIDRDISIDVFDRYFRTERSHYCFVEARKLVARVICNIDFLKIEPSHGPGAVFPPCRPSEKSRFNTIYTPIEAMYPFYEYFQATSSCLLDAHRTYHGLNTSNEIIARLTAVPKDSRGPRLISVHPKESVWVQQGIRRLLEDAITDPRSPCFGKVNFSDQSINGKIALRSSVTRAFSTIDLKEASDCISAELVSYLFGTSYKFLDCCRATHVQLFDGAVHPLRKYAPMGNATTFPVESLVFWAAIVSGISCRHGIYCDDVYVFGDDIAVPSEYYETAIQTLVRFGLLPGVNKCFSKGWFRESCGIDAFKGVNVTPIRLKQHEASSPTPAVAMCAMAKRLRARGYVRTATEIYSIVEAESGMRLLKSNNYDTQGLFEWVDMDYWRFIGEHSTSIRWTNTHQHVSKILQASSVIDALVKHDWYHVLDSLLRVTGASDSRKLEYPVPFRTRLVKGWSPVRYYVYSNGRYQDPAFLREEKTGIVDSAAP